MYIKKFIIYKNISEGSNDITNPGSNDRTNGFDILKDKTRIEKKLHKTKLCSYGTECKRGEKCRFAHSNDELVINNCVFRNSCKFIKKEHNIITNISKTKICLYKHPGENMKDFYERTNVDEKFVVKI